MTHLTMTGYYAGLPLCGIDEPFDKSVAIERGERFLHAVYAPIDKLTDLCAKCKAEWDGAATDDSEAN